MALPLPLPHCLSVIINPISSCNRTWTVAAEGRPRRCVAQPRNVPQRKLGRFVARDRENRNQFRDSCEKKPAPRQGDQHVRGKRLSSSYLATDFVSLPMLMMLVAESCMLMVT